MVYTLLAFLGGGFVIGRMAEQLRIIEPTLAAVAALLLDVLSTQAGWFEGIFLFSIALREGDYGTPLIIGAIAIVAAIAGALAGERLTIPQEDWVSQALLAVGLAGLLLGPFVLFGSYLPLAYNLIMGLALLGGILIAAYRFGRTGREVDEISIHPERHKSSVEQRAS